MRKSITLIFGGNLLSKVLGLAREVIVAAMFGTGSAIGAYRVAQTGTLVPVNFFTSDSLNAAFIPLYKGFLKESKDKAQSFFWVLLCLFIILSLVIGAGLSLSAPSLVAVLAPGLTANTAGLASAMLQIMGLGVPFYLVSALLIFLGMAKGDFLPIALRPSIQNIGLIGGALAAYFWQNALFFAWGFTIGYLVFCTWIVLRSYVTGSLALPSIWNWPQTGDLLHSFWRTLRPLLLLPVMLQGTIATERAVSTLIGLAAVSALDYARFVTETVILLMSVPVAYAGLSSWSGQDDTIMQLQLVKAILLLLVVSIPISVLLASHPYLITHVLYARGAFDSESINTTSDILFGLSLGLWAQVVGYVLIKALNAKLRNRIVLLIMALALGSNAAFDLLFYPYLGSLTLGIGNSLYGVVLFTGTLTALKLWRETLPLLWWMGLGSVGYLYFETWLLIPNSPWGALGMISVYTPLYWFFYIACLKPLRQPILAILLPKLEVKS